MLKLYMFTLKGEKMKSILEIKNVPKFQVEISHP